MQWIKYRGITVHVIDNLHSMRVIVRDNDGWLASDIVTGSLKAAIKAVCLTIADDFDAEYGDGLYENDEDGTTWRKFMQLRRNMPDDLASVQDWADSIARLI